MVGSRGGDPQAPFMEPFRFGLRRVLVLVFVAAGVAAWFGGGGGSALGRGTLTLYWIALAAYVVLRLPHLWPWIWRRSARWQQFRRRRQELEAEVARRLRARDGRVRQRETQDAGEPRSDADSGGD